MRDERNYGLDVYRILCCMGVLTYHIMDDVLVCGGGLMLWFSILRLPTVCRDFFCCPERRMARGARSS